MSREYKTKVFVESQSYRPFHYPWAVSSEKKQRVDMHWHEVQVDLADDLRQYMTPGGMATKNVSHESNKNMLNKLLMLFTEMDTAVGKGYTEILPYVKNNEIRTGLMTQAGREVTHQRAYALSAEAFGFTNEEWTAFHSYVEMQGKIDLLAEQVGDLSNPLNFNKKLAIIFNGEGIALFGAFACLLNLKRFGIMMNFNSVNEWSLKDEQEHVKFNMQLFNEVRKELTEVENIELDKFVRRVVKSYCEAEHRFIDLVFEMGDQEGMSKEQLKDYISYLGELRLYQIGLLDVSEVRPNPLPWIDYILSGSAHTNFFENRVTDYSHGGLEGKVDYSKYATLI